MKYKYIFPGIYLLNLMFYLVFAEENQQLTISTTSQSQISCSFNDDNCGWYTSIYTDGNINVRPWSRTSYGTPPPTQVLIQAYL